MYVLGTLFSWSETTQTQLYDEKQIQNLTGSVTLPGIVKPFYCLLWVFIAGCCARCSNQMLTATSLKHSRTLLRCPITVLLWSYKKTIAMTI